MANDLFGQPVVHEPAEGLSWQEAVWQKVRVACRRHLKAREAEERINRSYSLWLHSIMGDSRPPAERWKYSHRASLIWDAVKHRRDWHNSTGKEFLSELSEALKPLAPWMPNCMAEPMWIMMDGRLFRIEFMWGNTRGYFEQGYPQGWTWEPPLYRVPPPYAEQTKKKK